MFTTLILVGFLSFAEERISTPVDPVTGAPQAAAQAGPTLPEAPKWRVDPDDPMGRAQLVEQKVKHERSHGSSDPTLAGKSAPEENPAAPSDGHVTGPLVRLTPDNMFRLAGIAASVQDGTTVILPAGDYASCAIWKANNLTIRAERAGATRLRRATCENKGIFVLKGNNTTIDGLTFELAQVPDQNGAGIRLEGLGLTVRNSNFNRNENGILASANPSSIVKIENSRFDGNGKCERDCAHGVYFGEIASLTIRNSTFINTHIGHHIKCRCHKLIIENTVIDDGPAGNSSYLIEMPYGGDLILRDSILTKGPGSDNHTAFISMGAEGVHWPTRTLLIEHNHFTNKMEYGTMIIANKTATDPVLRGNQVGPHITTDN